MYGYLQNHLDTYDVPNMKICLKTRTVTSKKGAVQNTLLYKCDICRNVYINEDNVVDHRRAAHKVDMKIIQKDPNSCKICVLRFESQEELFKHTKTLHLLTSEDATQIEHEIFICEHCQVIFFNKQLLIFHMEFTHKGPRFKWNESTHKNYRCPLCLKRLKAGSLWYHFTSHQLTNISCCPICFDKCKDSDDLVCKHSKKHEKNIVCSVCGWVSTKLSEHTAHCTKHDKEDVSVKVDETNYKQYFIYCQKANKNYMQHFRRQMCLGSVHGVMLPVGLGICVVCKYIATSVDDMKKHVIIHYGPFIEKKKQSYQCTQCDEEFCNAVLLKQHQLKGCKPTVMYWG